MRNKQSSDARVGPDTCRPIRKNLLSARLALTILFGTVAFGCADHAAVIEDAGSQAVSVLVAHAKVMTLQPVAELMGTVVAIPERTIELSSQVSGIVKEIVVHEGQSVRSGETILILDDRVATTKLAAATAKVELSRAQLLALERGARVEEIQSARQKEKRVKAREESLRLKHEALEPLHRRHEIPDIKFQQSAAELKQAVAEKEAAAAELRLLEAGTRPERVAEARAMLAVSTAEEATSKLAVELCTVRSLAGGVITKLPIRGGMFVGPSTMLAEIVDLSVVFARVRVPRGAVTEVDIGALAEVRTPTYPERTFGGKVLRIRQEANPETGEVTAFIELKNDDRVLKPGLTCTATVLLPSVPEALAVPAKCVAFRDDQPVVTVIRDGRAYEIEVKLGIETAGHVQVLEGLEPGDVVTVEGGYGLPDGWPVTASSAGLS